MTSPSTEAGRALLGGLRHYSMPLGGEYVPVDEASAGDMILAIEAEARADALTGLDVERLRKALFAAMGWPTRKSGLPTIYGGVAAFPRGLVTGDPDNPEWSALASKVAAEYATTSAEPSLDDAWRRAEEALPEGWAIQQRRPVRVHDDDPYNGDLIIERLVLDYARIESRHVGEWSAL